MTEKNPNRTRRGLILLSVTVLVVIGVLGGDFVGRTKTYRIDTEDIIEKDEGEESYTPISEDAWIDTCALSFLGGILITVWFILGMSFLLKGRFSYGKKHSHKVILAFILCHVAPILPLFMYFYIPWEDPVWHAGTIVPYSIILFTIAIFLATYEIGGKYFGILGFIFGIGFSVPVFFVKMSYYSDHFWDSEEIVQSIRSDCRLMMIADIGLIIAMIFFLVAIRKALQYIKDKSLDE